MTNKLKWYQLEDCLMSQAIGGFICCITAEEGEGGINASNPKYSLAWYTEEYSTDGLIETDQSSFYTSADFCYTYVCEARQGELGTDEYHVVLHYNSVEEAQNACFDVLLNHLHESIKTIRYFKDQQSMNYGEQGTNPPESLGGGDF